MEIYECFSWACVHAPRPMLSPPPCPPLFFYNNFAKYAFSRGLSRDDVCGLANWCMSRYPFGNSEQIMKNICFPTTTPPTTTTTTTTESSLTTTTTRTTTSPETSESPSTTQYTSPLTQITHTTIASTTQPVLASLCDVTCVVPIVFFLFLIALVVFGVVLYRKYKRRFTMYLHQSRMYLGAIFGGRKGDRESLVTNSHKEPGVSYEKKSDSVTMHFVSEMLQANSRTSNIIITNRTEVYAITDTGNNIFGNPGYSDCDSVDFPDTLSYDESNIVKKKRCDETGSMITHISDGKINLNESEIQAGKYRWKCLDTDENDDMNFTDYDSDSMAYERYDTQDQRQSFEHVSSGIVKTEIDNSEDTHLAEMPEIVQAYVNVTNQLLEEPPKTETKDEKNFTDYDSDSMAYERYDTQDQRQSFEHVSSGIVKTEIDNSEDTHLAEMPENLQAYVNVTNQLLEEPPKNETKDENNTGDDRRNMNSGMQEIFQKAVDANCENQQKCGHTNTENDIIVDKQEAGARLENKTTMDCVSEVDGETVHAFSPDVTPDTQETKKDEPKQGPIQTEKENVLLELELETGNADTEKRDESYALKKHSNSTLKKFLS